MSYIGTGALTSLRDGRTGFHGELGSSAANSVGTAQLQDQAVTTAKIADGAVTNVKLAANSVTTDKILDGTILSADLAATGVGAGTYGGDGEPGTFATYTVNAQGQITAVSSFVTPPNVRTFNTPNTPIASGTNVTFTASTGAGTYLAVNGTDKIQFDNTAHVNGHKVFVSGVIMGTAGAGNAATLDLYRDETALGPTSVIIDSCFTSVDPANSTFRVGIHDYVAPGELVNYYLKLTTAAAGAFVVAAPGGNGNRLQVSLVL